MNPDEVWITLTFTGPSAGQQVQDTRAILSRSIGSFCVNGASNQHGHDPGLLPLGQQLPLPGSASKGQSLQRILPVIVVLTRVLKDFVPLCEFVNLFTAMSKLQAVTYKGNQSFLLVLGDLYNLLDGQRGSSAVCPWKWDQKKASPECQNSSMLEDNRWFTRSSPYVQQVLTAGCILSVSWEMSEESIIQRQGSRPITFYRPRVLIQYLNAVNVARWSGSSWNQFGQRRTLQQRRNRGVWMPREFMIRRQETMT